MINYSTNSILASTAYQLRQNYEVYNEYEVCYCCSITAAALTEIFSTIVVAYTDESETETEQELKQKNIGSGESFNDNWGANVVGRKK